MLGKIITIDKNSAIIKIEDKALLKDLINLHVVFEDENRKILGEIDAIQEDTISINFLGELTENDFIGGLIQKPNMDARVRIITKDELKILTGTENRGLRLGVSPLYEEFPLNVSIDEFFSNHTAIFGNTGSGKTYGICRIIQNIFNSTNVIPYKANLFIFDSYGEYINAFSKIHEINPYYQFKVITTNMEKEYDKLSIPVCLLEIEDLLNLLDATNFSQIAMMETALTYVKMFAREDEEAHRFKNHTLAKAIISLMYTNQTTARIRDQIFEILNETSTEEICLTAQVAGIGFTREFRNCFDIDSEGRFAEHKIIADYIKKFIVEDEDWNFETLQTVSYSLKDLEVALNFTLFSDR